jgi:lipopolysaccharide biosynthesis glycosyltransferase
MWSFGGDDKDSFPPEMREAYDHPLVVHYTTRLKPWFCKSKKLSDYFWTYASQTPFSDQLEAEYQEFLVRNAAENRPKYLQYKWMCFLTLGLNKKLKQKENDYLARIQTR